MVIALAATIGLASRSIAATGIGLLVIAMVIGAVVGVWKALRVEMTGMPELIALLHSFVGVAAVLVGWDGYYSVEATGNAKHEIAESVLRIHHAEVFIGVFIGAVTFTGSIVAFLKLSARMKSNPLMLPGRNLAQPRRAGRLRRTDRRLRRQTKPGSAHRDDRRRARAGLAPGGLHRWR